MAEIQTFPDSLRSKAHEFLTPDLPLHTDILRYLKHALDPVAAQISTEQQQRLQEARKKRKRGQAVSDSDVLRLKEVHVDGFGVQQIWEQSRRIIDAAKREVNITLSELAEVEVSEMKDNDEQDDNDDVQDVEASDDEGVDDISHDEDLDSDGEITNDALEDDLELYSSGDEREPAEEFVADKFGLNDGFFSIDDFNKQSEFLEQQDARGDNDGAASDEEEIDWDTNPLGQTIADADDEEQDDEDGPTFGDPNAASEDDMSIDEADMGNLGGMGNTNEVLYADFFAPPAQKKSKKKKGRPNPHNFPAKTANEEDVQRTIAAVQRDLFEDDDEEEEEEDEEVLDPADPRSRRSTHERRKAAIAEEIRKLEAANVAKREWTLSGEAKAADRPMNSLLEEDLEFERTGKPVPVITAEVTESIEELIKRRILAFDFQDIPRRRPDDLATGSRRGRLDFTLDDTKSKKGLAEEYEEEHLRKTDPNFVDATDEKLAKEQKEIEALWKDVCSKLDSLSSWHFRPKQAAAQLDIRVDAPTITMEDARPNAGGEVAAASQLAPQEIYKAGDGSKSINEEVVGKSGLPAAQEELSREDRKRRRQREKERIRKASGNKALEKNATNKNKNDNEKQVLGDLKKGGVKVIGKKGEMTDVEGKTQSDHTNGSSAARFKL